MGRMQRSMEGEWVDALCPVMSALGNGFNADRLCDERCVHLMRLKDANNGVDYPLFACANSIGALDGVSGHSFEFSLLRRVDD